MEKSRFFESKEIDGLDDRIYTSPEFAEFYKTFLANGVFSEPADGLLVSPKSGFGIEVAAGCALINGYWYENTDPFILTIDPIYELARIDLIILRLDLNDEERRIHLDILKGKLSSMPVDPVLTQTEKVYEIVIARIRLDYGMSEITRERIIDVRRDDYYCGVAGAKVAFDDKEMQNQINRLETSKAEKTTATQALNGLMSAGDKTKLDGISAGATAMVTGTYTGDGTKGRTITLGFTPKAVIVTDYRGMTLQYMGSSTAKPYRWYGGMAIPGYNTASDVAAATSWSDTTSVLGIVADGFKVNNEPTSSDVVININQNGGLFYYIAFN